MIRVGNIVRVIKGVYTGYSGKVKYTVVSSSNSKEIRYSVELNHITSMSIMFANDEIMVISKGTEDIEILKHFKKAEDLNNNSWILEIKETMDKLIDEGNKEEWIRLAKIYTYNK